MKKVYIKFISLILTVCLLFTSAFFQTSALSEVGSNDIDVLKLKVNGTNAYAPWVCLTLPIEAGQSVEFSFDMRVNEGNIPNFYYRDGTEYKLITPCARDGYRYHFKITGSDKNSFGEYNNFTRFCFDFSYIKSEAVVSNLELYETDANYENKKDTNLIKGVFGTTGKFEDWSLNDNYTNSLSKAGQICFMVSHGVKPFNHELFEGTNLISVSNDVFNYFKDAIKVITKKTTDVILPLNCSKANYYELSFNLKSTSETKINYSIKSGESSLSIPHIKINDRYYFRFKAQENIQCFKITLPEGSSTIFTDIRLYKADSVEYSNIDSTTNLAVGENGFSSDGEFKQWKNISTDSENIIPGQVICDLSTSKVAANIVPVSDYDFANENISLNWTKPGQTATLTITPDADKSVVANSLIVRRAKEGKEFLSVKRIGFQTENTVSNRYAFTMTEADDVINTMPFNGLEISVDFTTKNNVNISRLGWQVQKDNSGNINGIAFGSQVGYDVVKNQGLKDGKEFIIKEKGTIITRLETLQNLSEHLNFSDDDLLKFANRNLWARNGIEEYFVVVKQTKVFDECSDYIEMFGGIDGLTEDNYDIAFAARGYVIVEDKDSGAEDVIYTNISSSSVDTVLNGEQIGGAYQETNLLKDSIINTQDNKFNATNTTYYVSESGKGDGLSDSNPCNFNTFKNKTLVSGDVVLFARGSTFRLSETLKLQTGVTYAAYGSGNKPLFIGSVKNYKNEFWLPYDTQKSIYRIRYSSNNDIGIVLIDDGKLVTRKRTSRAMLHDNGDFYHDSTNGFLYLRCENFNDYNSIEIGEKRSLFSGGTASNINIDNLSLKCTGAHGISFSINKDVTKVTSVENIKVSNCTFSWIGGSVLDSSSSNQLYGNAIEFYSNLAESGFKNISISNCYITQIYDAGFTFQAQCKANFENISFTGNLVEKTTMPIEWWGRENSSVKNIDFSNNIFSFTGYGWGRKRGDTGRDAHITSGQGIWWYNLSDFNVKDNIFDCSYTVFVSHLWKNSVDACLDFSGNTYYQKDRTGINDLGYGSNSNTAVKYGSVSVGSPNKSVYQIDKSYGVTYYASNQSELEDAVKVIESNPNKVKWLNY